MAEPCFAPWNLIPHELWKQPLSSSCGFAVDQIARFHPLSLTEYLPFFFMTCVLESPIYFFGLKKNLPSWKQRLSIVFLVNISTHPAVVYLFPWLGTRFGVSFGTPYLASEFFAIIVEAGLLGTFWKVPLQKSLILSLTANLFSWAVGSYL